MLTERPNGAPGADERILDSWKEIAAYLGRAVRTVQTWEKHEGLPVHRHQHRTAGTVYAYPSEIESWKAGRDEFDGNNDHAADRRWRRLKLRSVLIGTVAVVAILAWQLPRRSTVSTPNDSSTAAVDDPRDWLLIADFENRAGDEILEGSLETAFRRELANHLKVAPRDRVSNTLRLMRRPADTPVDEDLLREVARRDREIRAVLTGRVERLPNSFLLSAELLDPATGTVLASFDESVRDLDAVLPAVAMLSRRVRDALGETPSSTEVIKESLRPVATPSFQALQLYSKADRLLRQESPKNNRAAELLLREAVAEDPQFASAHTLLAWTLARLQYPPSAEALAQAEEAAQLAGQATLRERYFIQGSLEHLRWISTKRASHAEAASAAYEALLQLDPGHHFGFTNAVLLLNSSGQHPRAIAVARRGLEARPNDVYVMSLLVYLLVKAEGDLEQARFYVDRARRLQDDLGVGTSFPEAFLEFFPVHERWVQGNAEGAFREAERIAASLAASAKGERGNLDILAYLCLHFFLEHGMFSKATELQTLYGVHPFKIWERGVDWARRNRPAVVEHIRASEATDGPCLLSAQAWMLSYLGSLAEAKRLLARVPAAKISTEVEANVLATHGTIALAEGRYQEAISSLEASLDLQPVTARKRLLLARSLARAWAAVGEVDRGVRLLEETSREKHKILMNREYWMEVQLELARLYRDLGRETEASEIEEELRRYCARSAPDFPIRRELEARLQSYAGKAAT